MSSFWKIRVIVAVIVATLRIGSPRRDGVDGGDQLVRAGVREREPGRAGGLGGVLPAASLAPLGVSVPVWVVLPFALGVVRARRTEI